MSTDPKCLSDDFRDFLISLNEAGAEYLLMGGHAVAHYGYVRPTTERDVPAAVSERNTGHRVPTVQQCARTDHPAPFQ